MIRFNFNLNKLEDPSIARARQRRETLFMASFAVLFFGLLCAALYWNGRLSARIDRFEKARAGLSERIRALETDKKFISERDVRELYDLDGRRVLWTGKLEGLARACGNDLAITEVRYQRGVLYVRGVAKAEKNNNNFERVSGFIDRLKAEPDITKDFPRIEFRSSNRFDFMDQPLTSFEAVCQPR